MKIQGRQDFTKPFAVTVYVNEVKLYPDFSLRIVNHSPDGFQWGYGGSGPAQLALALLALFTDEMTAARLHQDFKYEFITVLPKDKNFDVEIDIEAWIVSKGYKTTRKNFDKGFEGKSKDDKNPTCTFPDRCQKAEHDFCDCACGGINHSLQKKLF